MRRRGSTTLVLLVVLAAGSGAQVAGAHTLGIHGYGPLRLGMSRTAALATGWLASRGRGCELAGTHRPITYRVSGARAPRGVRGTTEFTGGHLRDMSFTRGVRTTTGVRVGHTTTARMVARYRSAGFEASATFDSTFQGTFVRVRRNGHDVLGGFGEGPIVSILAIPSVPVCE